MDERLKERLFACIFHDSDEAVVGLDAARAVQTWSRGAGEFLCVPRENAVGRPFSEFFPTVAECDGALDAAGGVQALKNYSARMLRGDGVVEKVFLTVHVLGDPVDAYLVLLTPSVVDFDVTPEHKAIQQALARMERFSMVGRMATAFAHEMRTPLHVISSSSEFALQFLSPGDKLKDSLEMILRNARYAALSIRALLDFAKLGKSQMREGSINAVVQTVLRLVEKTCQKRRIELVVELSEVRSLLIDDQQIRAVLHNLVVNAIEAMPRGGSLRVRSAPDNGGVRLEISDTGVGMSAEVRAKIDAPFFTTKEDGTGLGIYLAKRVLAERGATMAFETQPGRGTTVNVHFPAERSGT